MRDNSWPAFRRGRGRVAYNAKQCAALYVFAAAYMYFEQITAGFRHDTGRRDGAGNDRCGGNQSRAAKELGIPRRTLLRRLDEYGVPRPRK